MPHDPNPESAPSETPQPKDPKPEPGTPEVPETTDAEDDFFDEGNFPV
jgi:hypothetical protein